MILGEFIRALVEEAGARRVLTGDARRPVRGLAVDENGPLEPEREGWLEREEAAVTSRESLDGEFLRSLEEAGAPALVWRTTEEPSGEDRERLEELGLGLVTIPPETPLRRMFAVFTETSRLLLHSHSSARTLLEGVDGTPLEDLISRVSGLFGREVVLEDAVGRLLGGSSGPSGSGLSENGGLLSFIEEQGLRASRRLGVEETRRERRDRYARLPDGFLSVPVERWRVGDKEAFWSPIGKPDSPAGYLWMDLSESPLRPEDVVLLYWARRTLEGELDKERVRLETELGVRGDFVDDLISGHHGSLDLLLQRAGYLGANLSGGALALIVDIDDFARYLGRRQLEEPAIQEIKRRLADAVRLQARELFTNFLTGPRSDNVILLLAPSETTPKQELPERAHRLATRIQRYVKGLLPDLTVSIGIGRYAPDPSELTGAYSEAEVALEIGHRIHGPSSISTFEETGTYKLLFRVMQEDPRELESFYGDTLAPVVGYDSRYGTDLVHTLTTYLGNDASTVKTATGLFAHRHTIRYRLDRVGELTGLDVDKSHDREQLTLGIKVMQLLGHSPSHPSNSA
ncbi:helix-turn-helix domain-containing protein [Rubrobacter aplysinae]|uniref:helix-turn-helix domain-containing protein n=1 Tax=Rubrobacter aplysinae TaxID=909625 RepID=UPI00064BD30A|nr:helix-turn-helix domain-containing protein [Rubrobacter aplysinae]